MSGDHHHHDHHSKEQKPVAFTVPLILGCVTLLAVVLFLSLCDPKPHHDGEHEHGAAATEASHHEAAATTENHAVEAKTAEKTDSMTVETQVPAAEPAHH
ncbi:MAG: hypothetical protein JNL60_18470 [Bacteroidia bacterium]|nr:hypothetical protein [Bacteroidia bacterium]